jgi:hypothetical protein
VACCLTRARARGIKPGRPPVLRCASNPRRAAPAPTSAWVEGAHRAWLHRGSSKLVVPGHPVPLSHLPPQAPRARPPRAAAQLLLPSSPRYNRPLRLCEDRGLSASGHRHVWPRCPPCGSALSHRAAGPPAHARLRAAAGCLGKEAPGAVAARLRRRTRGRRPLGAAATRSGGGGPGRRCLRPSSAPLIPRSAPALPARPARIHAGPKRAEGGRQGKGPPGRGAAGAARRAPERGKNREEGEIGFPKDLCVNLENCRDLWVK